VRATSAPIVVFIDADVRVGPETVARLARALEDPGGVSAVFGAYDVQPTAPGLVSQFRNLLHHHVHHENPGEARTFWTGCGAVRREAFESVGGFVEERGTLEDVDLGYRLHDAGHRIVLDPSIQATHMKRWSLGSMLRADLLQRAIPWARLMLAREESHDHLNVRAGQRASVVVCLLTILSLAAVPWQPRALAASAIGVAAVAVLNRRFLGFLARQRGLVFAAAAVPLLMLHYVAGGIGYAWVRAERSLGRRG
jgi:GT2 family glycosyltransferase